MNNPLANRIHTPTLGGRGSERVAEDAFALTEVDAMTAALEGDLLPGVPRRIDAGQCATPSAPRTFGHEPAWGLSE